MKIKFTPFWYHEYKDHCNFHDYFNVMIHNFPILCFRKINFGLHDEISETIYLIGILGLTSSWNRKHGEKESFMINMGKLKILQEIDSYIKSISKDDLKSATSHDLLHFFQNKIKMLIDKYEKLTNKTTE